MRNVGKNNRKSRIFLPPLFYFFLISVSVELNLYFYGILVDMQTITFSLCSSFKFSFCRTRNFCINFKIHETLERTVYSIIRINIIFVLSSKWPVNIQFNINRH